MNALRRITTAIALLTAGLGTAALAQQGGPTLSSLAPATVEAGSPGLTLIATGTNFQSGQALSWDGLPLATTVNNSTSMSARVPASYLVTPKTVQVYVIVSDGRTSNSLSFTITGTVLAIQTDPLPQAQIGNAYTATLRVSGGTAPYRWVATSTLPPGLTLLPGGVVSGTPTAAGTFTLAVEVTDSLNRSATATLTLTITAPAITISNTSLANGVVGQTYRDTLNVTGGTAPYRWSIAQNLPAGLQLDPATGVISGTPTAAGSFSVTAQVTDAAQLTATRTLPLQINAAPIRITTVSPLFNGVVGAPYSQPFTASGGVPPYRWSILSGNTGGLTLDASSGVLQGTPQNAGSFTFSIQVTDSAGATASGPFSVTVEPPSLTITTGPTLPAGSESLAYSQTFNVTGGRAPYTWSATQGVVPGLTLSPAGVLSGTPNVPGTYQLTLTARDADGVTASRTFTLTINAAPLRITSATDIGQTTLNEPFTFRFTVAGGVAPYTWTANGLPEGLTLDVSTGMLSGTPSVAGTISFTVRVTDNNRLTAVDLFRLVVNLPPLPGAQISGLPATAKAADQLPLRVSLDAPFPAAIVGQAILSFAPDAGPGDGTIQFASGGRIANFTIAADTTDASTNAPLAIQTGTVAGTITVTLQLQAGGVDITPSPAPIVRIRVERAEPVIQSARFVRTNNGITIQIVGYSTAREVTQLSVTFTAAAGQTLQNATVTVPVEQAFSTWFQDSTSSQYGSQFFFTQPFQIQGDANSVTPQSVTLTNRVGATTANVTQ